MFVNIVSITLNISKEKRKSCEVCRICRTCLANWTNHLESLVLAVLLPKVSFHRQADPNPGKTELFWISGRGRMGVETSRRVDSSVRPATDRPDPSSTSSRQQQLRWPESGRKTGPSKSALGPGLVGRTDAFVGFVSVLSVPFFFKFRMKERQESVDFLWP